MTPKEAALKGIQSLPDDCTWEDVLRELRGRAAWAARAEEPQEALRVREAGVGWAVEQPAATNVEEGVMSRTYDVVTVVPVHAGETLGPGLTSRILSDANLTIDQLIKKL